MQTGSEGFISDMDDYFGVEDMLMQSYEDAVARRIEGSDSAPLFDQGEL